MNCEDCGTRLERGGICPNCHEELFIVTEQGEFIDFPLSAEFKAKVDDQIEAVLARNNEVSR